MKRMSAIKGNALKALRNKRLSQLKTEAEEVAPVVEEVVVEPQVVEKPKPKLKAKKSKAKSVKKNGGTKKTV